MKSLLSLVFAASLFVPALKAQQQPQQPLTDSVGLLYSQTEDGGMQMRCTVTAFAKISGGYRFVSAAHCVGEDDILAKKAADPDNISFYITFDEKTPKIFYSATTKAVGYQHKGDDFSVFEVKTDQKWPIIELGDEQHLETGDRVQNVASPLGLGKQEFEGSVTSKYLDRPIVQDNINWKGAMLLQINVGPGSSGSAVISVKDHKIVGFLVGVIQDSGTPNVIAIPVSRFKTFMKAKADGTYAN